jgi:hypothetical protein
MTIALRDSLATLVHVIGSQQGLPAHFCNPPPLLLRLAIADDIIIPSCAFILSSQPATVVKINSATLPLTASQTIQDEG